MQNHDAWLAGFFDGEGCIMLHLHNGLEMSSLRVSLSQKNREILVEIQNEYGGIIRVHGNAHTLTWQGSAIMVDILTLLAPHVRLKKTEVLIALEIAKLIPKVGEKLSDVDKVKRLRLEVMFRQAFTARGGNRKKENVEEPETAA